MRRLVTRCVADARRAWQSDTVRLVALTLYYLAIVVALAAGTSRHDVHPPFVYQAF